MIKYLNKRLSNALVLPQLLISTSILMAMSTASAQTDSSLSNAEAPSEKSIELRGQMRAQMLQSLPTQEGVIFYDYVEEGKLQGGVIEAQTNNVLHQRSSISTINLPPYNSTTVLNSGRSSNRIDIVIVGDGYTSSEQGAYATHVSQLINSFFSQAPLKQYKTYFNVHRVDVISPQSGVDNEIAQGNLKDTALDMGYWCNDIERLLCVNVSKALSAASNAGSVDQVLAIANSEKYGGAGYASNDLGTVSGKNGSSVEVAIHEFGHSFADLADEYTYGSNPPYNGPELTAVNVSILNKSQMVAQNKKWNRWMNAAGVNTFEGANYHDIGIFRPTENSKMRSLGRPFDPINTEQFLLKIYETVSPIDSSTIAGTHKHGVILTVTPLKPSDHALTIQWWVDGQPINNNGNTSFNTSTLSANTNHKVSVRVADNTNWVRDEAARSALMTKEVVWTVLAGDSTEAMDLSINMVSEQPLGWAEPLHFWRKQAEGSVKFNIEISNNGPSPAANVSIKHSIAPNAIAAKYTSSQGTCSTNNPKAAVCQLGTIAAKSKVTIKAEATVTDEKRGEYTATAVSNTFDTNGANNSARTTLGGGLNSLHLIALGLLYFRKSDFRKSALRNRASKRS